MTPSWPIARYAPRSWQRRPRGTPDTVAYRASIITALFAVTAAATLCADHWQAQGEQPPQACWDQEPCDLSSYFHDLDGDPLQYEILWTSRESAETATMRARACDPFDECSRWHAFAPVPKPAPEPDT